MLDFLVLVFTVCVGVTAALLLGLVAYGVLIGTVIPACIIAYEAVSAIPAVFLYMRQRYRRWVRSRARGAGSPTPPGQPSR